MRRIRTWSTAAVVVLAGALVVTLSPSEGTDAQWRDSASTSASGPSSDTFGMTATNVPDNASTPWPTGRMVTSPLVSLTNQSTRHRSWVNVKSSRLNTATGNDSTSLLGKLSLDYTVGTGSCETGGQRQYWRAGGFGQLTNDTPITRTQAKVDGATLPPGESRVLCPKVGLNYPSTTAGQRSALLNHAGRAVDITTVLNQRSEAPATWASTDQTVPSRYRVAMPAPETPQSSPVCRRTVASNLGGGPSEAGYYGGFFWGWPDAPSSSAVDTPAMAGGWEILIKPVTGGTWQTWKTIGDGRARSIVGINSRDISADHGAVYEFKLRGFPFKGMEHRDRYVESAWIARAENDWSLLTDRWTCRNPRVNTEGAGPHNMP